MAKGTMAKYIVEQKMKEVFGEDYVGVIDKKLYLWVNDNEAGTERVQIALAMTCPKVFHGIDPKTGVGEVAPVIERDPTPEELQNIQDTMNRLNIPI